jgi:hypothetical protein
LLTRLYSGTAFGAGASWFTTCPTAVTLDKASYTILDGTALGLDIGKALAGSGGTQSLPCETTPVLTLRSNQRGRSHRGRIYLPVTNSTQSDPNGRLIAARATSIVVQVQGLMTALGGPLIAPFWEMGIASYRLSVFSPLVTPTMDLNFDVQRRRKM